MHASLEKPCAPATGLPEVLPPSFASVFNWEGSGHRTRRNVSAKWLLGRLPLDIAATLFSVCPENDEALI